VIGTMEALLLVVYIIGAGIMFWALALVTEEKFVPSLNAFCAIAGIPPAVAGATLMAAGASSPELFGCVDRRQRKNAARRPRPALAGT